MKAKPFEVRFSLRGTDLPLAYIQARFYENGQRTNTVATGYKIPACDWDLKRCTPKHGTRPDIAHGLVELRNNYMMLYLSNPSAGIDQLRRTVVLKDAAKKKEPITMATVVKEMLAKKEHDCRNGKLKETSLKKDKNYFDKMMCCFQQLGLSTMPPDNFTLKHAIEIENYFRSKLEHNYAGKVLQWLRCALKHSQALGHSTRNGMTGIRIVGKAKEVDRLSAKELQKIEKIELGGTLANVRDLFLLQAYTGLNITDVYQIDKKRTFMADGQMFISIIRAKTPLVARAQLQQLVWLEPKALTILEAWQWAIFKISGQKANPYLRSIEMAIHSSCSITTKVARSTFAQLMYDVLPKEVVQRMLGHQQGGMMEKHYAQVSANKIVLELRKAGLI